MKRVKDTLAAIDVRPHRSRGQNFIIHPPLIDEIMKFGAFVAPEPPEILVEIGPGLGALTERLVPLGSLTVIELEHRFAEELKARFPGVQVIESDVRKVDLSTLAPRVTVVGNLPYIFSTDILFHLITHRAAIVRAVLMFQREFAERVAARPSTKAYGSLSVVSQLVADLRLGTVISGRSFHPPTEVESRLIELTFRETLPFGLQIEEMGAVERVVRASFSKRRKMLSNSLRQSGYWSREVVSDALGQAGIDGERRAETLSPEEFVGLTRSFLEVQLRSCAMGKES